MEIQRFGPTPTPLQSSANVFRRSAGILFFLAFAQLAACTLYADEIAATPRNNADRRPYSPAVAGKGIPHRVFWGDTHLHTNNSLDAGLFGCRLGPEDAFRFARGEQVVSSTGVHAKLSRPYDFLVVADHSDYMGLIKALKEGSPELLADPMGKQWYAAFQQGGQDDIRSITIAFVRSLLTGTSRVNSPGIAQSSWALAVRAADNYNEPGKFTAFIGYEWTSTPAGDNLHRNVIFRDDASKALQVLPLTTFETQDPEKLWQWMADYEAKTGGEVLAIPHNSNLSGGRMFADTTFGGKPFDLAYAKQRATWEPLVEITQSKGDSETDPTVSPNDDFANFERWDKTNLFSTKPATPEQQPFNYVRPTLTRGLKYAQKLGVNPFKFGVVGGTDSHTGLSTVDADNFFGNRPASEPGPGRIAPKDLPNGSWVGDIMSSGLTAVWATENTREAIFEAFRRKEVYATTGPRITVRVFAGWDFKPADVFRSDFVAYGYARGVPMGSDLSGAQAPQTPTLLIQAAKDPDGANLDRIQVIKGWLDSTNQTHEAIFDAVWSGERTLASNGKLASIQNTVDAARATYSNRVGAPVLYAAWQDPQFDPRQRAYYYVRAIEIQTPRWSTYDSVRFGVPLPENAPASIAQRAYTSPIWYAPNPGT